MAVTSVTAIVKGFVVDASTPANNNTFYVDFFGNDGSYSSSIAVNADITQTAQQVANAIATAVVTAVNTALGTSLTADNVLMLTRPSSGPGTSVSGDIASGSIGQFPLANGAVTSGAIASGSIGSVHIASGTVINADIGSGAVTSGRVGDSAVVSGSLASGQIAGPHLASGVLNAISGSVVVSSGSLLVGGTGSFSGTLSGPKFNLGFDLSLIPIAGNQSVVATWWGLQLKGNMQSAVDHSPAAIGANDAFSVAIPNQKPGSVGLAIISASGQTGDLQAWYGSGSLGTVYAAINASGEFRGQIASGVVTSGAIASGQVSDFDFASGAKIDSSEWSVGDNVQTAEMISGGRYVTANSSGQLVIAMATQSGREECIGVVLDNTLSGAVPRRYYGGRLFSTNINMSGAVGQSVFLSLSGNLVANSVASLGSGNNQIVGVGISVSGMLLNLAVNASGNVGRYRIASGGVLSGHVGSGQVGGFHLSSGAITSGRIASGQIGSFHLASGSVTSGRIASGSIGQFVHGSGSVVSGHLSSGNTITYARNVLEDTFVTTEVISGVRCVRITASGFLQIAMAAVSGRMPADGVALVNAASGALLSFVRYGHSLGVASEMGSGLCISGRAGSIVYVGASGQVVTISGGGPTIGVGATNSGGVGQIMGRTIGSGRILVAPSDVVTSGAALITTDPRFWPL